MKKRPAFLRGLAAGLVAILAGSACAQPWDPARTGVQSGWVWNSPQRLDTPQARMSAQSFRAPVPPLDAARALMAAAGPRLTRLRWAGPVLLLSGGAGAEHWLAHLQPQADGTEGLVSHLRPGSPADVRFDPASLAPPGSRRMLQLGGGTEAEPASLSSFEYPGTLAQASAAVRRALQGAGWSAMDGAASLPGADPEPGVASLPTDWRHPRDGRLSVHLHARHRSVALLFWHHPQEPS